MKTILTLLVLACVPALTILTAASTQAPTGGDTGDRTRMANRLQQTKQKARQTVKTNCSLKECCGLIYSALQKEWRTLLAASPVNAKK